MMDALTASATSLIAVREQCADSILLAAVCWQRCAGSSVLAAVCWQQCADSGMLAAVCWQQYAGSGACSSCYGLTRPHLGIGARISKVDVCTHFPQTDLNHDCFGNRTYVHVQICI